MTELPPDLLLVSCAVCRCDLARSELAGAPWGIPRVAAWLPWRELRSHKRPYCQRCYLAETATHGES